MVALIAALALRVGVAVGGDRTAQQSPSAEPGNSSSLTDWLVGMSGNLVADLVAAPLIVFGTWVAARAFLDERTASMVFAEKTLAGSHNVGEQPMVYRWKVTVDNASAEPILRLWITGHPRMFNTVLPGASVSVEVKRTDDSDEAGPPLATFTTVRKKLFVMNLDRDNAVFEGVPPRWRHPFKSWSTRRDIMVERVGMR